MVKLITTTINGRNLSISVEPGQLVVDVLREQLFFSGTKNGCGTGDCGACTILWNGKAVNSCLLLANRLDNATVWTIEGLAQSGELDPVQEAFVEEGATQCGYCTPGFVMRTVAFLSEIENPTVRQIQEGLVGNVCRCTGYVHIINAVKSAATKVKQLKKKLSLPSAQGSNPMQERYSWGRQPASGG